jgi:hypothetical protein
MQEYKVELLDLRAISRASDRSTTKVDLIVDYVAYPWIVAGECNLREVHQSYELYVRAIDGLTDAEHDSAYAIILPLVGVKLLSVQRHEVTLVAWINAENSNNFRVPNAKYDPTMLPGAFTCTACDEHHLIVPEAYQYF